MRIGHYAPGIFAEGGVATYIRRVGAEQVRLGHEVVYFDLNESAGVVGVGSEGALLRKAKELGCGVLHVHRAVVFDEGELQGSGVKVVRSVHDHTPYCPSGTRYLSKRGAWGEACPRKVSVAGCLCGHYLDRCGSVRPAKVIEGFARVRKERRACGQVLAIANSEFVRGEMIRNGYDAGRIVTLLLPGPERVERRELTGVARFLFLGRLVPEKGAAWLVEAAGQVKAEMVVDIAGDGREMGRLKELVAARGLGDRVKLHGWVDQQRALAMVDAAWAVVVPSLWHEPAGFVTLEAAARGRAAIVSEVGGIPEYGNLLGNAVMVKAGDVAGLAGAMRALAGDRGRAEELGVRGWEHAERLSLSLHVGRLMGIYGGCPR